MNNKRVTVFAGHYGSGKTNIAINYALFLKRSGFNVSIADLDIVNPYFRTKDGESILKENAVKLITSKYAGSNIDLPSLPAEINSLIDNKEAHAVMDVGGDDRGALALGRYAEEIKRENNYEMLFVINKYRPLTADAKGANEIKKEIEKAGKLPFTAIVNNSNIGEDTTAFDVISSLEYAKEVSYAVGLPIKMTAVRQGLFERLKDEIDNLFPIQLYVRQGL
ncbi:MAG TPA: hypothetical protein VFC76_09235 [Oscillospiraceae bacterium]|nr:hypothetical protein [Oscillospiraceae bacterium]